MYIPTNGYARICYDNVVDYLEAIEPIILFEQVHATDADEDIVLPVSMEEYLSAREALTDAEYEELREAYPSLRKFANDAGSFDEAIREDTFEGHIRDLIDECYEMPKEMKSGQWPYRHITIDYAAAADEARQDYYEVDFDGVTYLCR